MKKRTLTPAQQVLATSTAENVCAIAGPGSGKTHVLIERYSEFPDPGTHIVTFTNAAAKELIHRIQAAMLPAPKFVGTLHSLAMRMIKAHLMPEMTLLDEESAEDIMVTTLKDLRSKLSTKRLRECLEDGGKTQPEKLAVMSYRARLRENKCEDYDTLLLTFKDLLERKPIKISRLMVDEYQDSGSVDHAIYGALQCDSKFIVGDPDQSIYGFRGGKIENILEFSSTPGVFTGYLETNFRSDKAITKAATALIGHNSHRLAKATVSASDAPGLVAEASFTSDAEELTGIIDAARELSGHTAVLVRYNADRTRIANALAGARLAVREPEKPNRPADWPRAMVALALGTQPNNQILLHRFLILQYGKAKAAELVKADVARYGRIKAPAWPGEVKDWMQLIGMSHETRGKIAEAYAAVGGNRIWHEAAAEMAVWLHHETIPADPAPAEGNIYEVMTIHASKGLEFDNVIIPGVEEGTLPGKAVEEDRRLMFVAITRARHKVLVSWAERRLNLHSHKVEERKRSRFLNEIVS